MQQSVELFIANTFSHSLLYLLSYSLEYTEEPLGILIYLLSII